MNKISRVAALAVIAGSSVAANAALYSTGFEAPDYMNGITLTGSNGWTTLNSANPVGQIETSTVKSGSQAVKLTRSVSDNGDYGAVINFGGYQTTAEVPAVRVEWDMMVLDGTFKSDIWGVGAFDGPFAERFTMGVNDLNKVVVRNAAIGTVTTSTTVSRNAWNHFQMDLNYQTKKADVSLNGSFIGQWSMLNGSTTYVDTVLFNRAFTGNDGAIYDNLQVSTLPVPEPVSMAALGIGAIGLLRRRKK